MVRIGYLLIAKIIMFFTSPVSIRVNAHHFNFFHSKNTKLQYRAHVTTKSYDTILTYVHNNIQMQNQQTFSVLVK